MELSASCWACSGRIDAADSYCRHCGRGQGACLPWYYHPLGIAILTVLALGPFVLPLVWKTPKLGPRGRWIATGLVALFTLYVLKQMLALLSAFQTALTGIP